MTRHKEGEWEERLKVYADKKGAYKHIGGRMTDRFPSEKEAADSRISAEEALHDMILALIYLTRFKETGRFKSENELFRAWKSYDWDTLDKLNEEGLIIDRHGNKSLYLTEEGEQKAKEILEKYGISDWEKKNSKSE